MDEEVVLVDEHGHPVGSAPRTVVRRDNLRHAATAVLVRDEQGRIYVHRRSPSKDWAPSAHDAAAGGILRVGEGPAESAVRELDEELGIDVAVADLRPLGLSAYDDDTTLVVEHCFETTWAGSVRFADDEVVWGSWFTLAALGERLRDPRWPFVPDTRALLERLRSSGTSDYAELGGPLDATSTGHAYSAEEGELRARAAAEQLGLDVTLTRHGRVASLEEAAAARGVAPRQVVKTLVVRISDVDHRLVLVPGDREIAWPKLRALLGVSRLSLPDAETAYAVTGYVRGTITPLGSLTAWPVIADRSLTEPSGPVSIGAGAHGVAFTVDSGALVTALNATVADITDPR